MKRRIISVLLLLAVLTVFAAPASAAIIQPMAAVAVDGGLTHDSGSTYILWSSATGATEFKSTSATLYRKVGTTWSYVTQVYAEGTSSVVTAEKDVTLTAGQYKVNLIATSSSGSATRTRTYTI